MRRIEFHVAGIRHRLDAQSLWQLGESLPIKALLIREPENSADPNAIKVVVKRGHIHMGYVPAGIAVKLAPRLDAGKMEVVSCKVIDIDVDYMVATAVAKLRRLLK
jgi:hypothetical protein